MIPNPKIMYGIKLIGDKDHSKVIAVFNTLFALFLLLILTRDMGCYHPYLYAGASFILLSFYLIFNIFIMKPRLDASRKKLFPLINSLFFIILSFGAIFYLEEPYFKVIALPLLIVSLKFLNRFSRNNRKEYDYILILTLLYFVFSFALYTIPPLWHTLRYTSYGLTKLVGLAYGPSTSGLYLSIPFFIAGFIQLRRKLKSLVIFFALIVIAMLLYVKTVEILLYHSTLAGMEIEKTHYLYILFIVESLLLLIFTKGDFYIYTKKSHNTIVRIVKRYNLLFLLSVVILFIVSVVFTPIYPSNHGRNILFYRKNSSADWNRPDYSRFGKGAAGMFGLLPDYLDSLGFNVGITDDSLNRKILESNNVLVIINPSKNFTYEEKELMIDFVRKGGSLLVMGDHTDVGGIMHPLNDILSPFGIKFNFDSALPFSRQVYTSGIWIGCQEMYFHPAISYRDEGLTEWLVGASLDAKPWVVPLLIGKYSFSDYGDYFNVAYLGDYRHESTEIYGDTILAAVTYYGKGKVLVFGDTTSLQNPCMPISHSFVNRIFRWLSSDDNLYLFTVRTFSSFILVVLLSIFVYAYSNAKEKRGIGVEKLTVVIVLFLLMHALLESTLVNEKIVGENIAYIDSSHNEKFNILGFKKGSIYGFMISLMRNGYLPFIYRDFDEAKISSSKLLVVISPSESFTKEETRLLERYMLNGGIIILSTGFFGKENVEYLLHDLYLDIANIPLGPVPYTNETDEPHFVDAYPIIIKNNTSVTVLYSINISGDTYPLVIFKNFGKGGLLLFGDTQFLYDKNIESASFYNKQNIEFLRYIFGYISLKEES